MTKVRNPRGSVYSDEIRPRFDKSYDQIKGEEVQRYGLKVDDRKNTALLNMQAQKNQEQSQALQTQILDQTKNETLNSDKLNKSITDSFDKIKQELIKNNSSLQQQQQQQQGNLPQNVNLQQLDNEAKQKEILKLENMLPYQEYLNDFIEGTPIDKVDYNLGVLTSYKNKQMLGDDFLVNVMHSPPNEVKKFDAKTDSLKIIVSSTARIYLADKKEPSRYFPEVNAIVKEKDMDQFVQKYPQIDKSLGFSK